MDVIIVGVVALVVIVTIDRVAPKLGVAAPLLLVLIGVAGSFIPQMPDITVEPELVLAGVLPPLLYSSAARMPSMDFRRDFSVIGGLSVLLVIVSSIVVGWIISLMVPDMGLATGIALAAVLSPSDAVATSLVRKAGVSPRVVTILEGESLFNDASSLAVMKAAIAAMATTVSLWGVAGGFVYSVVVASIIGVIVGHIGLRIRSRISDEAASTAISFTVPFIAYLPSEHIGASGLVAVAAAGLITGNGGAKYLRSRDRHAERSNWETVGFLLEGGVFLLMGLELRKLIEEVHTEHSSVMAAVWIALVAAVAIILIRALFFIPLLAMVSRKQKRSEQLQVLYDRLNILGALDRQAVARARAYAIGRGAKLGLSLDGKPVPGQAPSLGGAVRLPIGRPTETTGGGDGPALPLPVPGALGGGGRSGLRGGGPGAAVFPAGGADSDISQTPDSTKPDVTGEDHHEIAHKAIGARGEAPISGGFTHRDVRRAKRRAKLLKAGGRPSETRMDRFRKGWRRRRADVEYFLDQPLGPKEGVVLVWSGMRGVVTLAAAQSLPTDTPHRSLLVLVAFCVAAGTLLIQGGTLPALVRWLDIGKETNEADARAQLLARMGRAGFAIIEQPHLTTTDGQPVPDDVRAQVRRELEAESALTQQDEELDEVQTDMHRDLHRRILDAQRSALLDARSSGEFPAEALKDAMDLLDLTEMRQEQARRVD